MVSRKCITGEAGGGKEGGRGFYPLCVKCSLSFFGQRVKKEEEEKKKENRREKSEK